MCFENIQLDAAAGEDSTTTSAPTGPILSVNDPRLDDMEDPVMQKRRKVLAVLGRNFPMAWKRRQGFDNPCELEQGEYKKMNCWTQDFQDRGKDSCSSVNHGMMGADGAGMEGDTSFDVTKRIDSGWVPYRPGSGLLPSVGDTYLLKKTKEDPMIYHCGIICQVSVEKRQFWICADGGQKYLGNEAAELVPRILDCKNAGTDDEQAIVHRYDVEDGEHMRYMYGWLDLGHPKVILKGGGAYDRIYTEKHYKDFKALILRVDGKVKERFAKPWSDEDTAAAARGEYEPLTL
jgi:hypothetical protein